MRTIALSVVFLNIVSPSHGAVYTYQISNYPAIQNGANLAGTITVDTASGTESPASSGNFYVGHSAITAWDFSVTPTVGGAYSVDSSGINPLASGLGGSFAMYATPSSLAIVGGSSLKLQADDGIPGATVELWWYYDTPIYNSGGVGAGGAIWLNTDRTVLDNTFPTNPDASAQSWVIATVVPEPSGSALLGISLCILCGLRRRVS
ncbi:PEP-CTERM sorting domain-containing protein [Rubritalea tangerina]|uniref:PEP-CTERM sorting domain-containing protein n=1 Tax=Rubritalea tangerina TaxID=430798 RepID=A0ABW4Z5M3_9BACT